MLLEFKKKRTPMPKKPLEETPSSILGPNADEWYDFFVKVISHM
jgi:hypothetical protein